MRLAQQSDPLSLIINTDVAEMLYYARRYDEAIAQARRTLEMEANFALVHHLLGWAYLEKQPYAESIEELKTAVRVSGGRADLVPSLAVAYAKAGQRQEALHVLEQLKKSLQQRPNMSLAIARVLAAPRRSRSVVRLAGKERSSARGWAHSLECSARGGAAALRPVR